jgi:hypothetical protein
MSGSRKRDLAVERLYVIEKMSSSLDTKSYENNLAYAPAILL